MPRPMIISVLPPPMSTTRRRPVLRGQRLRDAAIDESCLFLAGDDLDRMADGLARPFEKRPVALHSCAARWCLRRARNWRACAGDAGQSVRDRRRARAATLGSRRPSSSTPSPRRTISRSRSMMTSWLPVCRATTMWKLLVPRSTAARTLRLRGITRGSGQERCEFERHACLRQLPWTRQRWVFCQRYARRKVRGAVLVLEPVPVDLLPTIWSLLRTDVVAGSPLGKADTRVEPATTSIRGRA